MPQRVALHMGSVLRQVPILLAVLLTAGALGIAWRRRSGRAKPERADRPAIDPALGAALGLPAGGVTLLQFSTAFCQPCRATRRVLSQIAAETPGVHHVDVDAESHLDAVRALRIVRTPTTLLFDSAGRIRNRVVGQPRPADVHAALASVLGTVVPAAGNAVGDD
ncbi:MAG: thioredoxin family protein [Actinomycetota bacterium]|nr:thioredoxin family protein [Actinomycetota bacterium]